MQEPVGKFHESLDISFPVGELRCHALKLSYEWQLRSFPAHSHGENSWEIHYIPRGKGRVFLNGIPFSASENSFFITGPHVEHAQISDVRTPMDEYCVYLRFDRKEQDQKRWKNPDFLERFLSTPLFFGQDRQGIHGLMKDLFRELEERPIGYLAQAAALLTQLLILSVRNFAGEEQTALPPVCPGLSQRLQLIIEESFLYDYRDLTLETLSRRLGLGPRQTQRLLQKHYGQTFRQKKAAAQMSAALILLGKPDLSLSEIALRLGYSSAEHFSAAFKRQFGAPPGAWRREHRDQKA